MNMYSLQSGCIINHPCHSTLNMICVNLIIYQLFSQIIPKLCKHNSGLARFSHPGKYRAVITVLGKTSNSGKYQTIWEKLLNGLNLKKICNTSYCAITIMIIIIHHYWLFSNNHNCSKTENNNTTTKYYIPKYIQWQCYRFTSMCCLFTLRFQRNKSLQVYTNKYNINILLLKHWKNNIRHKLHLASNLIILMPTEEFINYQSLSCVSLMRDLLVLSTLPIKLCAATK